MKKILYGVSDFNDIITSNAYYLDKTSYIEKIEQLGSRHLFFFALGGLVNLCFYRP